MKVKELIEELQKANPDSNVLIKQTEQEQEIAAGFILRVEERTTHIDGTEIGNPGNSSTNFKIFAR